MGSKSRQKNWNTQQIWLIKKLKWVEKMISYSYRDKSQCHNQAWPSLTKPRRDIRDSWVVTCIRFNFSNEETWNFLVETWSFFGFGFFFFFFFSVWLNSWNDKWRRREVFFFLITLTTFDYWGYFIGGFTFYL